MNVPASQVSSASAARGALVAAASPSQPSSGSPRSRHNGAAARFTEPPYGITSVFEASSVLARLTAASTRVRRATAFRKAPIRQDEIDAAHFLTCGPAIQRIVDGATARALSASGVSEYVASC